MEGDPEDIKNKIGRCPYGDCTANVVDVMERKSHRGRVSRSSHLQNGWRGGALIGELTVIGEVSIDRDKISCSSCLLSKWWGDTLKAILTVMEFGQV